MQFRIALILLCIFLGCILKLDAQQVPIGQNKPDCSPPPQPQPLQSLPALKNIANYDYRNFVRIFQPQYPVTSPHVLSPSNWNPDILMNTMYYNGLGRPIQNVQRYGAGYWHDVIHPMVYDQIFGNEEYKYLPYSIQEFSNRGKFRANVLTELKNLYDWKYPGDAPYFQYQYDNSVLNEAVRMMPPGNSWVGSGAGTSEISRTNTIAQEDRIAFFHILTSGLNDLPSFATFYPDGFLEVKEIIDEDGNKLIKYFDKAQRLVAERRPNMENLIGVAQADWHKKMYITYYVYDDFSRLRFIIPPEAFSQAYDNPQNSGINSAIADGLCYKYWYDGKGRLYEKKMPGKDVEYYLYDKRNRLILRQDGLLRSRSRWAYTVYDKHDRILFTGEELTGRSRQDWINCINNDVYNSYNNAVISYYLLKYDIYNEYPPLIFWDADVFVKNYYDLDFGNFAFNSGFNSSLTGSSTHSVVPQVTLRKKGLLTGQEILIKEPNNWHYKKVAFFYDDFGRMIQQHKEHKGGMDILTNQYDFAGDIVSSYYHHNFQNKTFNVVKSYVKDYARGKVVKIEQKINNNPSQVIYENQYDAFNRVSAKSLGGAVLNKYSHNIRGFVTAINPDHFSSNHPKVFFGEKISYNSGFNSLFRNGNISGIEWRGYGVNAPTRFYGYTYDKLGRLTHAEFGEKTGSCNWSKQNVDYTVSNITYDWNGNIKTADRKGVHNNTVVDMDKLVYEYYDNSNQIKRIEDNGLHNTILPDFKNNSSDAVEYTYDANGNLSIDLNKGITLPIIYNETNKVTSVNLNGKGTIQYLYDGLGNKISKLVDDNNANIQTRYDYIGPFVYKNDVLQFINHEEGRTRFELRAVMQPDGASFILSEYFMYDYFVKDHLGNVRSVVTAEPIPMQEYLADHEVALSSIENLVFENIDNVRDNNPSSTDPNDLMAAVLDANDPNKTIGTAIMLRVMAGDRFAAKVNTFFDEQIVGEETITTDLLFNSVMNTLLGGNTFEGVPISEIPENATIIQNAFGNVTNKNIYDQLINSNVNTSVPSSHLSYLLFDEELNLVAGNSGAVQWGSTPGQWNEIGTNGEVEIGQNGYLVCFISTRSASKITHADKLRIQFYRGRLLEEDHYYPFGLTLSNNSINPTERNKIKYNTKELQNDEFILTNGQNAGLEWYDYGARMYDPQIGRWNSIDPLASDYCNTSPYAYVANDPVKFIDPDGRIIEITGRAHVGDMQNMLNLVMGTSEAFRVTEPQSALGNHFWINANDEFNTSKLNKQQLATYEMIKGMITDPRTYHFNLEQTGNQGDPIYADDYKNRTLYVENINNLKNVRYTNTAYMFDHFFREQSKLGPNGVPTDESYGIDHDATVKEQSAIFGFKTTRGFANSSLTRTDYDILTPKNTYLATIRSEKQEDGSYKVTSFIREDLEIGDALDPSWQDQGINETMGEYDMRIEGYFDMYK